MMSNRPLTIPTVILAAMLTPGLVIPASADVVTVDNFGVTLGGVPVFTDTFSTNQVLAGGGVPGSVLPSGTNFADGSPGLYLMIGTVTETGGKATLDTALGAHLTQSPPFFPHANANIPTLLTGPPGSTYALTPSVAFSTSALFDMSVPATLGGFYQVNLSDRVASNYGMGDVISMTVINCAPIAGPTCGSNKGPTIELVDANNATGTISVMDSVALATGNQQIMLELTHPTPGSDAIDGYYGYVNGGVAGPLTFLGSYGGLFAGLDYTQAGIVQLAPVPESSTLPLLVSSISGLVGLAWLRRRKLAGGPSNLAT